MAAAVALAILARPTTVTPAETKALDGIYQSLNGAGQRTRIATAGQCQAVALSEERRKTMRDDDATSADLKEICKNGGDFYDCVVASANCALSKNGYTCVKRILRPPDKRRAPELVPRAIPTLPPRFAHRTTVTFLNKAEKALRDLGIELLADGGTRVAEILLKSDFEMTTINSALNSTKTPEKRAQEKANQVASEEKKLLRKMRAKEEFRKSAAAADSEVGRGCVT